MLREQDATVSTEGGREGRRNISVLCAESVHSLREKTNTQPHTHTPIKVWPLCGFGSMKINCYDIRLEVFASVFHRQIKSFFLQSSYLSFF